MKAQRTGKAAVAAHSPPPDLRPFAPGEAADCPCGGRMTLQTGLTHAARNQAGLVIVANLTGLVCGSCGARSWDPPTYATIQAAVESRPAGFGASAKVSRLSRDNVGAYLPKDLQRHMGIHAGDELVLQPINERLLLVEVRHPETDDAQA
ncbi:MAG: hypothetical protein HYT80_10030 [Euryarchaeota archaeon]|nr:hypothetical protein [Euryarchaeota archaeon]